MCRILGTTPPLPCLADSISPIKFYCTVTNIETGQAEYIEIKNVKLRNKENSNNNEVKTSESIKIGSFLHQFDEYDLIDTYYF